MRRLFSVILSCAVMGSVMAQESILWDGESYNAGTRGGCWDDGSPTVVANPKKDGVNPSDKCLKFSMTDGSKVVKIPFRDWTKPQMNGRKRFSLMIRKPMNENVMIEVSDPTNGSAAYYEKVAAWYGGNGEWERVVFDFSGNGSFDCPGVISITAQTSSVSGTQDVYIDNVVIEDVPKVNGTPLADVTFGSLSGDVTLTGSWAAGSCLNANAEEWKATVYDDFEVLAAKLSSHATSVDMRGASVSGAHNTMAAVNPNILIYANELFSNTEMADAFNTQNFVETPDYSGMPTYFTPPVGFVGDVMPYYDEHTRKFMIAYLQDYRPNPACYHPIHMITSDNLSAFTYHGEAIACGAENSQEQALGTGCIFYDDEKKKYYAFYTAHQDNYSSLRLNQEELFRATSIDGVNWTKEGYVLKAPAGYYEHEFRDPQIIKVDGTYHMLVTAMKTINGINYPCIAHFTATDIDAVNTNDDANVQHGGWTPLDPFFVDMSRGNVKKLYECPDIISIGDRYYLIYSDQGDGRVHYKYRNSLESGEWTDGGILDAGGRTFYAAKTAYDGYDHYLFGWCTTTEGTGDKMWAGSLIIHKLYRDDDGKLALTVPHAFDAKFSTRTASTLIAQSGTPTVTNSKYDLGAGDCLTFGRLKRADKINLTFKASDASNGVFGFVVRDNSDNDIRYSFRLNLANRKLYFNEDNKSTGAVAEINQASLPDVSDGIYDLRIYHEQSVIVVYVNDKVAMTSRLCNVSRNPWSVFCESGNVQVSAPKTYSY